MPLIHRISIMAATAILAALCCALPSAAQRKITPVKPAPAATTNPQQQRPVREVDPKANLAEARDAQGNIIFIDTVSGTEWVDTTIRKSAKMIYPLLESVTVGVNLWDPAMRLLGQDYGGADIWAELSLHNRYKPVVEFGLSSANITPDGKNYTFHSPLAPYFRIGANYNIFYNNNPAYQFLTGVRYGLTFYKYDISEFTLDDPYWGISQQFSIPSQSATTGFFEFVAGVRVMLGKQISLGWMAKYHAILHESKAPYGKPMYIPGYGKRGGAFSASFSISYTLPLGKPSTPTTEPTESE